MGQNGERSGDYLGVPKFEMSNESPNGEVMEKAVFGIGIYVVDKNLWVVNILGATFSMRMSEIIGKG